MSHPRYWSNRAWTVALVSFLAFLLLLFGIRIQGPSMLIRDALLEIMPIVAGVVALASLSVAAISATSNWNRIRRQATIEAWTAWSNDTIKSRKLISQRLGTGKITESQAKALIDASVPLIDSKGLELSLDDRANVGNSMILILNGLERLAVGSKCRVYDERVLRELGATIIVRWYEMFSPYIEERRTTSKGDLRQKRVFIALDDVVISLRLHTHQLDQERLKRLAN